MDVNGGRKKKNDTQCSSTNTHATRISHYRAFTGPIVWRSQFIRLRTKTTAGDEVHAHLLDERRKLQQGSYALEEKRVPNS